MLVPTDIRRHTLHILQDPQPLSCAFSTNDHCLGTLQDHSSSSMLCTVNVNVNHAVTAAAPTSRDGCAWCFNSSISKLACRLVTRPNLPLLCRGILDLRPLCIRCHRLIAGNFESVLTDPCTSEFARLHNSKHVTAHVQATAALQNKRQYGTAAKQQAGAAPWTQLRGCPTFAGCPVLRAWWHVRGPPAPRHCPC